MSLQKHPEITHIIDTLSGSYLRGKIRAIKLAMISYNFV